MLLSYNSNMRTQNILGEEMLLNLIQRDIVDSERTPIIMGGHFPMTYDNREVNFAINYWNCFSSYTFDLSTRLVRFSRSLGRNAKIALVCDDHWLAPKEGSKWYKPKRNEMYRSNTIPVEYQEILRRNGLETDVLLRHNHGKPGREACPIISENALIAEATQKGIQFNNNCAKAYSALTENLDLFDKQKNYLIGFIPNQCRNNVCGFLDITNIPNTHVFFKDDWATYPENPENFWKKWGDGKNMYTIEYRAQKDNNSIRI